MVISQTISDYVSQGILVADKQRYSLFSKADLSLLASGQLQSKGDFPDFVGDVFYADSTIVAATTMRSGQVNLESFRISQPVAPAFQTLAVDAVAVNFQVVNIDSISANYRRIYAQSDWNLTVYNQSPDKVENFALSYNYFQSYNCGGDNLLVAMDSLSLMPGDSVKITLNDLSHTAVITGTDFSYYLKMAPIMANGNILKSGAWHADSYTIQNVNIPESESSASLIKVYPNPVNDRLWLDFNSSFKGQITLNNPSGQPLLQRDVDLIPGSKLSLDLAPYPAGFYLLRVNGGAQSHTKRLLIK
ncbi:MAG: T9SS type A sorting domain-containing protein [Owenweeksia sp.]|nr:T9SS type A sorting domain-containing protein [Owenweeksia sp.]